LRDVRAFHKAAYGRPFGEPRVTEKRLFDPLAFELQRRRQQGLARVKGKPFLREGVDARKLMRRINRRVLPGFKHVLLHGAKARLVESLFGAAPQGKGIGLVVLKPTLFRESYIVRRFLRGIGATPLLFKPMIFKKRHVQQVYENALREVFHSKQRESPYWAFAMHALNLLSGPNLVIVFKHGTAREYLNNSVYLNELKKTNRRLFQELVKTVENTKHPQDAFSALFKGGYGGKEIGTLRASVVLPSLKNFGFDEEGKRIEGLAKRIDALGFYERFAGQPGYEAVKTFTGVHIPNGSEIQKDANALLTTEELEKIRTRLERLEKQKA
jgi:hypothetical protein